MSFVTLSTTLQLIGYFGLALRLIKGGLAGIYRYLTWFLIFEGIRVAAASALPRNSIVYGSFYFATQPLLWTFQALITLEVFHVAFRRFSGLDTVLRRTITFCFIASLVLSAASLTINVQQLSSASGLLENFHTLERTVYLSLLLFILLLVIALSWFPVPLTRNAVTHVFIFAFFFAAKAALYFGRNVYGPAFTTVGNYLLLAATMISVMLWATLLTRTGEESSVISGYRRSPEEEQRLLRQLESINQVLSRSVRK